MEYRYEADKQPHGGEESFGERPRKARAEEIRGGKERMLRKEIEVRGSSRAFALAEDPGLVPSTHKVVCQSFITPVSMDLTCMIQVHTYMEAKHSYTINRKEDK